MQKSSMWIIFYSILFLIGAGLSYGSFTQYRKTQLLLSKGIRTNATVIKLLPSVSDGTTVYSPVFEYTDRSMVKHIYESSIQSYPAPYKIGEKVKIIYNPRKPKNVKTISFWGLYRGSVILFMIAAPFLIIGGSYMLYSFK